MTTESENKCIVCGVSGKQFVMYYCDRTIGGPWCSLHFEEATGCTIKAHGEGCITKVFEGTDI